MRNQQKIDSDKMWSKETYSFSVKLFFFISYINFTPTTSPRCVKKDWAGGVGQSYVLSGVFSAVSRWVKPADIFHPCLQKVESISSADFP